ncbi:hypothetical protein PIB30_075128, partial [Stylosanthes scabra]|nr:hypothetical protein [Stylosanthes scabra]
MYIKNKDEQPISPNTQEQGIHRRGVLFRYIPRRRKMVVHQGESTSLLQPHHTALLVKIPSPPELIEQKDGKNEKKT